MLSLGIGLGLTHMRRSGGAPVSPIRSSNYGIRLWHYSAGLAAAKGTAWIGSSNDAVAGGYVTSHVCCDAESDFDAVQLIFANSSGIDMNISGASIAPGTTLGDLTNSTAAGRANFVPVTFSGASSAVLTSGINATAPNYLISDEIACASLPRAAGDEATWSIAGGKLADSFTRPLLHVRVAQYAATTNPQLNGYRVGAGVTDAPYNPSQPTLSGRFISVKNATHASLNLSVGAADALVGTAFGPFTGLLYSPLVGLVFKYRTKCMSVICIGDSITENAGLTGTAGNQRPWSLIAQQEASTMAHPVEYGQLARGGVGSSEYLGYLQIFVATGLKPNVVLMPTISPNDSAVIPANLSAFVALCAANDMYPIIWTGLPVGPLWGISEANEAARVAVNNGLRARTSYPTADWLEFEHGSPTYMTDDATPIASIPPGLGDTTYNVHPTYTGDGVLRQLLKAKILSLGSAYF